MVGVEGRKLIGKTVFFRMITLAMIVFSLSACERVDKQAKEDVYPRQNIYPWQIKLLPEGKSRVFGITLGESTLNDASILFEREYKLGLFETANQPLSLEAYFNEVTLGGISGKFVLTLEASQEELAELLKNTIKRKVLGSGAKRYSLGRETTTALEQKRIKSLSYIPYINLDEEIINKRFGEPAERIIIDEKRQHLLYPELGLDLLLDEDGKELLQYVTPAEFEQLRQPLLEKYKR